MYSQSRYVAGKCNAIKYPIRCGDPSEIHNFTAKDLGEEKAIHIKMGSACAEMKGELGSWVEREDFMSQRHDFRDVAVKIGDENNEWVDVNLEVERSAGVSAGNGMCRKWHQRYGPMWFGAICAFPIEGANPWDRK